MDPSIIQACTLSTTLQYAGIRFHRFVHALQQTGEDSLWEKINWHSHVLAEVVRSWITHHIE